MNSLVAWIYCNIYNKIYITQSQACLLTTKFPFRLPIVQGGNFAYFIPIAALLTTNFSSCEEQARANLTETQQQEAWQAKMRLIQGNIAVSSIFQILLGFTGGLQDRPQYPSSVLGFAHSNG